MIELTEAQQERVDIISHKLKFTEQKPTVACITALDMLMADGELTELISLAGGVSVAGDYSAIQAQNPDVIILMPKGDSVSVTMGNIAGILQMEQFSDLKAVKNNRLYIADSEKYFQDNAENLVDSLELLSEIIYPKQFIFGYEGEGWIKFGL